jgi:hypothetical protein
MKAEEETGADLPRGLFDLIGYMLTSARGLLDEPAEYGPLRLVEGVSRLCQLMMENYSAYRELLGRLKEEIDGGKFLVTSDMEAFRRMVDRAVGEYTRLLKRM